MKNRKSIKWNQLQKCFYSQRNSVMFMAFDYCMARVLASDLDYEYSYSGFLAYLKTSNDWRHHQKARLIKAFATTRVCFN